MSVNGDLAVKILRDWISADVWPADDEWPNNAVWNACEEWRSRIGFASNETCCNCRFAAEVKNGNGADIYLCRFNPPTVFYAFFQSGGSYRQSEFPEVKHWDWCGKFELDQQAKSKLINLAIKNLQSIE